MLERRWLKWLLLLFGAWTLFSIVELGFQLVTIAGIREVAEKLSREARDPPPLQATIFWGMMANYLWAALTPLIIFCARRFRIERQNWLRGLLFHFPTGLLIAATHIVAFVVLYWSMNGYRANILGSFPPLLRFYLFRFLPGDLFFYGVIVLLVYAYDYYRKYREGELKAAELRAQLAQAQLQALKMQLHPHFLFNTLNAISELVYKDPEAAEQMITQLSDMLRLSLDKVGVQEVSLKQELEFLGKYLEIEQTRFQERLRVEMQIDPATLDASVPNMILQPLVENAVRHGIAPRATGGRIEIRARRSNGMLQLDVHDDGRGLPTTEAERAVSHKSGVGLANTRARLAHLYGAAHRFALESTPGEGLTVRMAIPFREAKTTENDDRTENDGVEDTRSDS